VELHGPKHDQKRKANMHEPRDVPQIDRRGSESSSSRVLARQRHESILNEIRVRGAVRVTDLAAVLGVSDMTIRRDLDTLDEAGLLQKVHGGAATLVSRRSEEPGFEIKSLRHTSEKTGIGIAAAQLVSPGTAIGIGAGTTTWQLAKHILGVESLLVVTNSIRVAELFNQSPRTDRTVILTGGIRTPSDALVGPVADLGLRSLNLDTVFLGAHGMSERAGFTSPNLVEAETNRKFAGAAKQLVMLVDHTKWDLTALSSFAALSDTQIVVTDMNAPASVLEILRVHVDRVVVAEGQD
jgi:DeoR/GlpR family transcriptional regulator of sugar metabolism